MAKLVLSMDGLVLKEIPLDKERISIGRKSHNDIQIDNLAISGSHAAIVTILNDSFLEDLDSTNGTYVNGLPVKKHFLQSNDVIEMGKFRLKYLAEPVARDTAEYEKTVILRPEDMPRQSDHNGSKGAADAAQAGRMPSGISSLVQATQVAGVATGSADATSVGLDAFGEKPVPVAAIHVLSGVNAGRLIPLTKTLTTMGKPGLQVAVIARCSRGYEITQVEGSNLALVNGQAVGAQAQLLNDRDVLELAGVRMEFLLQG